MSNTSRSKRPNRDVSALEDHLGYWLRALSNHVSHAFKMKVEAHGVTVAEWVVLRALFDVDRVKPSALAAALGLSRGAVSKLVDRLASKDLVSVRSDVRDGRSHFVTLRAAGRHLVPVLAALADANDATAFGHLDEKQRALLLQTVKGIVTHLGLRGAPVA